MTKLSRRTILRGTVKGAAVGMALSSLLVTLNALRLTRLPAQVPMDTHAPRI